MCRIFLLGNTGKNLRLGCRERRLDREVPFKRKVLGSDFVCLDNAELRVAVKCRLVFEDALECFAEKVERILIMNSAFGKIEILEYVQRLDQMHSSARRRRSNDFVTAIGAHKWVPNNRRVRTQVLF